MTREEYYKAREILEDIGELDLYRSKFLKCSAISINDEGGTSILSDYCTGNNSFEYVKEILDEGIAKKIEDLEREFEEL